MCKVRTKYIPEMVGMAPAGDWIRKIPYCMKIFESLEVVGRKSDVAYIVCF